MLPRTESWNEGTFGCSPGTKPERGYVPQSHPFTKPPFYLPVRVLRRFSNNKCFLEGFLEGACEGFSVKTRFLEGFLEGSVL